MNGQRNSTVIIVHGLWFGARFMKRMARRLSREGYSVRRFAYRTTGGELEDHAAALLAFARESEERRLHFVCHSLGGLVLLRMLSGRPGLPPGRAVLLGSPIRGSRVARKVSKVPGARKLLGEIRTALQEGYRFLPPEREIGMIAGSRRLGLGLLVGGPGGPGDGTVSVLETANRELADHLVLRVTHTGMLYSREVARQTAHFLRTGAFERPSA